MTDKTHLATPHKPAPPYLCIVWAQPPLPGFLNTRYFSNHGATTAARQKVIGQLPNHLQRKHPHDR